MAQNGAPVPVLPDAKPVEKTPNPLGASSQVATPGGEQGEQKAPDSPAKSEDDLFEQEKSQAGDNPASTSSRGSEKSADDIDVETDQSTMREMDDVSISLMPIPHARYQSGG